MQYTDLESGKKIENNSEKDCGLKGCLKHLANRLSIYLAKFAEFPDESPIASSRTNCESYQSPTFPTETNSSNVENKIEEAQGMNYDSSSSSHFSQIDNVVESNIGNFLNNKNTCVEKRLIKEVCLLINEYDRNIQQLSQEIYQLASIKQDNGIKQATRNTKSGLSELQNWPTECNEITREVEMKRALLNQNGETANRLIEILILSGMCSPINPQNGDSFDMAFHTTMPFSLVPNTTVRRTERMGLIYNDEILVKAIVEINEGQI